MVKQNKKIALLLDVSLFKASFKQVKWISSIICDLLKNEF